MKNIYIFINMKLVTYNKLKWVCLKHFFCVTSGVVRF